MTLSSFDKNNNKYSWEDDSFILKKLSEEKCLFSKFGFPVMFINSQTKHRHFRHYSTPEYKLFCERYGVGGETEEHSQAKIIIYNELLRLGFDNVELEKKFDDIFKIADIYFEYDNKKYAIEIQKSEYPFSLYEDKIKKYKSIGIECVYIGFLSSHNDILKSSNLDKFKVINNNYILYFIDSNITINNLFKVCQEDDCANVYDPKIVFIPEQKQSFFDYLFKRDATYFRISKLNIDSNLNELRRELLQNKSELQITKDNIHIFKSELNSLRLEHSQLERSILALKHDLVRFREEYKQYDPIRDHDRYLQLVKTLENDIITLKNKSSPELDSLKKDLEYYQQLREREVASNNRTILAYLKSEKYFQHDELLSRFGKQGLEKIKELIQEGLVREHTVNGMQFYIYSKYQNEIILIPQKY